MTRSSAGRILKRVNSSRSTCTGSAIEHAGLPALYFQVSGMSSAEKLTLLAHRHTLRVLNVY